MTEGGFDQGVRIGEANHGNLVRLLKRVSGIGEL